MAVNSIIQVRNTTKALWLTSNPVLALNEIGWEQDTGQYKVGDGSTSYISLSYGGTLGPAQTTEIDDYGDGSDGNVTISVGVLSLTRDTYFNNLTLSGTGQIYTSGYRLFVLGILDITAAGASAIHFNGNMGGTGTAAGVGGTVPAAQGANSVGGVAQGVVGGAGNTGAGTAGGGGATIALGNGASGATGSAGGAGNANAGGTGGTNGSVTTSMPIRRWGLNLIKGVTIIAGGAGAGAGGGGGGDGTNKGGGGGASANSGGVLAIYARTINRGGSTAAACISANGGTAGNGGTPTTGIAGGGGGGGGGAGGWVYLAYGVLTGSSATNAVAANSGAGGTGGNGIGGNGTTTGVGGNGGSGGFSGRVTFYQVTTGIGSEVFGNTGTGGSAQSGGTGGAGGPVTTNQVSL